MSLTSQLHEGYLASWCARNLPGTAGVVDQIQAAVRTADRPVRPAGQVAANHWAAVGGIVDARLSSLVQLAPPYGALLGAVRLGAMAWGTAELEATAWPSHDQAPDRLLGLSNRPSPTGWIRLPRGRSEPAPEPVEMLLGDFLDRLLQFHTEHAPAGRLGADGAERQLARAAWVVAQLEGTYRSGHADQDLVRVLSTPGDVEQLLRLAPESQVAEAVEILRRLEQAGALQEMRDLAGKPRPGAPLGYAGPVLLDRWADGDLILTAPAAAGLGRLARRLTGGETGPASTLVDVKTVMRVDDAERVARWLWQIVGYVVLDGADLWRIRRAGLLLSRHGVLVTWPVNELLAQLGGVDVDQAGEVRRTFAAAVGQAARSEGADLGAAPVLL